MHRSQSAVLRLVALDSFHSQLVAMMLDLLNPKLRRSWSTSDAAAADAVLVDVDTDAGRRHLEERRSTGLGRRTIALGSAPACDDCPTLPKPLRLHPLLSTLSAIESEAVTAPAAAAHAAPRFRLQGWPELDPLATSADELRIFALLSRQALDADRVAEMLGIETGLVDRVLAALHAKGLLARVEQPSPIAQPPRATGAFAQQGLIGMLRRRFGL